MSTPLIVNGKTFNYPIPGESPGWGEDASDWAKEVTTVLGTVLGTGDIAITSSVIANNQLVASNVLGLSFDPTVIRSALISYEITRTGTVSASPVTLVESGQIEVLYNGSTWNLARRGLDDAGCTFTITSAGQVQYISTDISAGSGVTGYVGIMKFKAQAFTQA